MLTVDQKAADVFAGKVVRKDLVRKIKVGASQTVKVVRAGELKDLQLTVGEAGR